MNAEQPRVEVGQSPTRCPYCHAAVDRLAEKWLACAACLARHHEACWKEHGRCSACGEAAHLQPVVPPMSATTGRLLSQAAAQTIANIPTVKKGEAPVGPTLNVGPDGFRTIAEAIRAAVPGTRILIAPGIYNEALVIDRPIALMASGARAQTIIETATGDCILMATDLAIVRGLTLRVRPGLSSAQFATVQIPRGQLRISECDIASDTLGLCVSVRGRDANPVFKKCKIHDGKGSGVLVTDRAQGIFEDCEVQGHKNFAFGVHAGATPTVVNCVFRSSKAGVHASEGGLGTFKACEATNNEEANVQIESGANPLFQSCKIHGGRKHGLLVTKSGEGTFDDCKIFNNADAGVATDHSGNPLLRWCKISEGQDGVVATAKGLGKFENCQIVDNEKCGVVITLFGDPTLDKCKVRRNRGTGISVTRDGAGTVRGCDLLDNVGGPWSIAPGCKVDRSENKEK